MSHWVIFGLGIVLGMALVALLRRKSVQRPDQVGDTQYIRPHLVAAPAEPPAISPELERLNEMQSSGTISQAEYEVLRSRLVESALPTGSSTVTIVAGTSNKINDIKAIRAALHLGLKDAKDVADRLPQVVAREVPAAEAYRIRQLLEAAGLQVRVS